MLTEEELAQDTTPEPDASTMEALELRTLGSDFNPLPDNFEDSITGAWATSDTTAAAAGGGGGGEEDELPSVMEVAAEVSQLRPLPRVWVLMGGEGVDRHMSLRSGVNVWAKLQRYPDLQVMWV